MGTNKNLDTRLADHTFDSDYSSFSAITGYVAPKATVMKTDINIGF